MRVRLYAYLSTYTHTHIYAGIFISLLWLYHHILWVRSSTCRHTIAGHAIYPRGVCHCMCISFANASVPHAGALVLHRKIVCVCTRACGDISCKKQLSHSSHSFCGIHAIVHSYIRAFAVLRVHAACPTCSITHCLPAETGSMVQR